MARRPSAWTLPLAALGLLCPSLAWAQTNYESALIGGRSSLMGGTGVVGGTDAAVPLQNPASTVSVEGTSFVFSTFFIQVASRHLSVSPELITQVEKGTSELSETQLRVLPNSTCLFFDAAKKPAGQVGSHKLSVCVAEPEREGFDLSSRVLALTRTQQTGYQHRFLSQLFSKKVYAVSWGMTLGRGVSIGATPMLEQVSHQDTEAIVNLTSDALVPEDVLGSAGKQATTVVTQNASAFALSSLFGIRFQAGPNFGAGISLQTPSLHIAGSYASTRSSEDALGASEQYQHESGSARFTYPMRLAFGIAGRFGRFPFEFNTYVHNGRSDFAQVSSQRTTATLSDGTIIGNTNQNVVFQEGVRPTVNVGIGVEFPLPKHWSILTGFLTDIAGLSPRQTGASVDNTLFRNRSDLIHGSIGVAWTPPVGSLLLGTRFFYGEGELATSQTVTVPPTLTAQPQQRWGISLVISGQISLEMLALADPTGLVEKAAKSTSAEHPTD